MIFILNSTGIPSVSKVIKITGTGGSVDTTPPGQVGPLTITPMSDIQLNLSWAANTEPDLDHYNVYRGTTPGFTVTLGTTAPVGVPAAPVVEVVPGRRHLRLHHHRHHDVGAGPDLQPAEPGGTHADDGHGMAVDRDGLIED